MRHITAAFICMCLLLNGLHCYVCADSSDCPEKRDIRLPKSSSYYEGKNYEKVAELFKKAGFTSISTEILYDIYFGWTDEGSVESVTIGDIRHFKKGDIVGSDTPIVITYHMSYSKDPSLRTYDGVVYDHVLYDSEKDGLRARGYFYYFFNESEKKVFYIMHSTAGNGRTHKRYGTYEGSFDEKITITFKNADTKTEFVKKETSSGTRWEKGKESYIEKDVKDCLPTIRNWD